jgi:hypothetical protein
MVATERSGRVTGRVEASGQESAVGRAATLQAVTRVKPEQASKVKSWMLTRLLTGEGRANREETDKHLFGPPGYWARHAKEGDLGNRGRSEIGGGRTSNTIVRMVAKSEVGEGHGTVESG